MTSPAPGHRAHPAHRVLESRVDGRMAVDLAGQAVADSRNVVRVDEDGHPPRFYFPRGDVQMQHLTRSAKSTYCPFKGQASYFNLQVEGRHVPDAAWSYEDPYAEHIGLKGRLAFDERTSAELQLRSVP